MNDSMREFSPAPIERPSLNTVEASVTKTVSNRFKGLGEKARSVARMATQRAALTAVGLALLISSGSSNTEQPSTSTPPPMPISTVVPEANTTEATVGTPEKEALTDVEFVSNLLDKYLNLDADPELKKLKDLNYLGSELSKFVEMKDPVTNQPFYKKASLGAFKEADYNEIYGETRIRRMYEVPYISILVTERKGEEPTIRIYFGMDKEGNMLKKAELAVDETYPDAKTLNEKVLKGTKDASKYLKNKPGVWSATQDTYPLRVMDTTATLSDGSNVKYSVGTTGNQHIGTFIYIN